MEKIKKITNLGFVFISLFITSLMTITSVYAWFNGVGYIGDTMSYSKRINIGSTDSNVVNYHGKSTNGEDFSYSVIDSDEGFIHNNLTPGDYIFLRTDIENTSSDSSINAGLFLQDIIYDENLNNFLYFGVNNPVSKIDSYMDKATYNQDDGSYKLESVSLLEREKISSEETLSVYWYVYIDSTAGLEIASANINLGNTTLTYN